MSTGCQQYPTTFSSCLSPDGTSSFKHSIEFSRKRKSQFTSKFSSNFTTTIVAIFTSLVSIYSHPPLPFGHISNLGSELATTIEYCHNPNPDQLRAQRASDATIDGPSGGSVRTAEGGIGYDHLSVTPHRSFNKAMIVRGFRGDSKAHKIHFPCKPLAMPDFISIMALCGLICATKLSAGHLKANIDTIYTQSSLK
ncbi:hypothetical protein Cgig2_031377 [Carnegiea gigantea]|uniref:Uncharacterized protein n=1 Tax=Carnegiea gigantea TaxID=171969 RepID=A0A9Q1JPF5_9CARY|nr:hypothetical protein Cgig2_031377 [Carnegiea gigantea]